MAQRSGESRTQAALFPAMLDELVLPDAPVRVVDAWIASLNFTRMGSSKTQAQVMGRPPYDPADLFKLYVCGYLDGVRSSRALEQMMKLRHRTVEHSFGTIKHEILRNARLLMRGLAGAKGELSLAVLAYSPAFGGHHFFSPVSYRLFTQPDSPVFYHIAPDKNRRQARPAERRFPLESADSARAPGDDCGQPPRRLKRWLVG